jgi:putative oxidoreductase
MRSYYSALGAQSGIGLVLLRLMTSIVLVYHGYQKIFVTGLGGVAGFFEKIGIILPQITGPFVGLLEFVGGILLFLGIFTRLLASLFVIEFIVAAYAQWILMNKGYIGSELELMIVFSCVLLATNGAGRYALHSALRLPAE